MDPYYNTTFFKWCCVLWRRMQVFDITDLYPDEIQLCILMLFALIAGLLGVLLVLSKNTLLANSISHTMLLGIVLAFIGGQYFLPGVSSIPSLAIYASACAVGLVTCYIIDRLSRIQFLSIDSSNAMVFSLFFALGIAIISVYSRNAHIGPELLMGDPDALEAGDIPGTFFAALLTVVAIPILLRGCTVAIFDPSFATVSGFRPTLFMRLMLLLTSMASIVAFRAVGFVMTMAFFVIPPLISRTRAKSIGSMLGLSAGISLIIAFLSVGLSRHLYTVYALSVSTGAFAAVLLAVLYFLACIVPTTTRSSTFS